jgi:hypothetical protein
MLTESSLEASQMRNSSLKDAHDTYASDSPQRPKPLTLRALP